MRKIFLSLVVMNLLALAWGMVATSGDGQVDVRPPVSPNPYQAYPQLKLLSEIQSGAVLREPADSGERQPAAPNQAGLSNRSELVEYRGRPLCELVGPFESEETADNFVERLNAIEVQSSVRDIELPAGPGYWVYLSPRSNRREALRLLGELQAKRIDSYVIPKGDLANGISLGMFSKKSSSDARVREMQSIGLQPRVEEIERSYREIWVMLDPGEQLKMSDLSWQRVMDGINMLERRQNYCLDIAS